MKTAMKWLTEKMENAVAEAVVTLTRILFPSAYREACLFAMMSESFSSDTNAHLPITPKAGDTFEFKTAPSLALPDGPAAGSVHLDVHPVLKNRVYIDLNDFFFPGPDSQN